MTRADYRALRLRAIPLFRGGSSVLAVARALGVSRMCAHRWRERMYEEERGR